MRALSAACMQFLSHMMVAVSRDSQEKIPLSRRELVFEICCWCGWSQPGCSVVPGGAGVHVLPKCPQGRQRSRSSVRQGGRRGSGRYEASPTLTLRRLRQSAQKLLALAGCALSLGWLEHVSQEALWV